MVVLVGAPATAGTIYVDVSNTGGVEDGSQAHPWNTIQEGINAASNGDEVVVLPGEYVETITFGGSNITSNFTLRSIDPYDPDVVAATIINGDLDADPDSPNGTVVTLTGEEGNTCVLTGLTITGGYTTAGGGILGSSTHATISYCIIKENRADEGAGIWQCDGVIAHNWIIDNIAGTVPSAHGGGLGRCYGVIKNNLICRNHGDGLTWCHGIIIQGNTIADHTGWGLNETLAEVTNCIIWGNEAHPSSPSVTYCCIENWEGGGEGNIVGQDPLFVSGLLGDYYLSQTAAGQAADSPCVDAGSDTAAALGLDAVTTRTDSVPDTGIVDMGYHHPLIMPPSVFPLSPGWGLIGDPPEPCALADCKLDDGVDLLTWADAVAAGWVDPPLYFWQAGSGGGYQLLWSADSLQTQHGHWIQAHRECALITPPQQPAVPYTVSLEPYWNMIGDADHDVALSGCSVDDGSQTLCWADAITAGWIIPPVYYYHTGLGGGWRTVATSGGDDDSLRQGRGHWILANQPSLTLIAP